MYEDLRGKVAIVTGAAGGIGEVYASALLDFGARVVLADNDEAGLAAVQSRIGGQGRESECVGVDVSDETSVANLVAQAISAFGGIDVLINNAALHLGEWSKGVDLSPDRWRRILDVNVVGPFMCSVACRPYMADRGGGSIINQSSSAAYQAVAGAYSVSKLGLNGLTMVLARELAGDGIRVNGIAPGFVASPAAVARVEPENRARARSSQLLQVEGQMDHLVGAMLYLASAASSFVTSQTISVDGGITRRP